MKPTRLRLRRLAENQIIEAFNTYGLQNPKRAQNWMESVDEAFTAIEHFPIFPLSYAILFDNVRRVKVGDFPYLLLYFVSDSDEDRAATIVACVHERSNPQQWRFEQ